MFLMIFSKKTKKLPSLFTFLMCCILLTISCSSHEPVKNLTSDICLILPENNTKKDVIDILGKPDKIQISDQDPGTEEWIYYQVHKSFLKKIPLIRDKFGHEDFDVVIVTFNDERVTACLYRSLTKDQLEEHGIKLHDPSGEE